LSCAVYLGLRRLSIAYRLSDQCGMERYFATSKNQRFSTEQIRVKYTMSKKKVSGIGFVGSDGTGKTTLLSALRAELGSSVIVVDEVARSVIESGFPLGKNASRESYIELSRRYQEKLYVALQAGGLLISERTALDPLAYALVNTRLPRPHIDRYFIDFLKAQWRLDSLNYVTYFYFPIEFDMVADGVRVNDQSYRDDVSQTMLQLTEESLPRVAHMTGTVGERLNSALSIIQG